MRKVKQLLKKNPIILVPIAGVSIGVVYAVIVPAPEQAAQTVRDGLLALAAIHNIIFSMLSVEIDLIEG